MKYLRSRLINVCRCGQPLGWMETSSAEVTAPVQTKVKREQLTLEMFQRIHARAPEVAERDDASPGHGPKPQYLQQGGVDTKALLRHASENAAAVY